MVFMIHIDKSPLRLHRVGCNQTTFDELVWCLLEQVTVLECPRLMLARIADEIVFLHSMIQNLFPLDAGRKACATPATEPCFLQFIDDIVCGELFEALLPGLVPPDLAIALDFPRRAIKHMENSWFSCSRHALALTHSAQRITQHYKV